jgi:hypothetical protein
MAAGGGFSLANGISAGAQLAAISCYGWRGAKLWRRRSQPPAASLPWLALAAAVSKL